jgi:hypothetical protein
LSHATYLDDEEGIATTYYQVLSHLIGGVVRGYG